MLSEAQLLTDIDFLARRACRAGSFSCDVKRDWGMSANSIVALAYGIGEQDYMPSDRADYAACVRAVRSLPRHRRTGYVIFALRKARMAYEERYPRPAGREALAK